ncbi:Alpha/Beta hydrolase protein [Catenaria anguillulae PL171]|uniref:Alpha/Beta hydrolase protein n=1 Tax=Catenaria anguillulae PL171 TaxID=765915 RepID=A0A1Y2H998_9FUNG|nr:Alpha/Beta hydrolase protein [Catenaria anguillulae PL171]
MNVLTTLLVALVAFHQLVVAMPTTPTSIDEQRQILFAVSKRVAPDLPQPELLTFLAGDIPEPTLRVLREAAASNGTDPIPAPTPRTPSRPPVTGVALERVTVAAHFASMSYCGTGEALRTLSCGPKCSSPIANTAKVERILEGESTFGFVAVRRSNREIVVSFRGTSNEQNEADNMDLSLTPWPFAAPSNARSMQVHRGFTRVYGAVRDQTLAAVRDLTRANPGHRVVFTGHSLGGALATMAAVDVVASSILQARQMGLVTFGAPRVGDRAFAQFTSGAGFRCIERVVNANDFIAHIPARAAGYQHISGERYILGDRMFPCLGADDQSCSASRIPFVSLVSHVQFFSQAPFFGQLGCRA